MRFSTLEPQMARGTYPFAQGNIKDFEPIFERLIELSPGGNSIINDPEVYASTFLPTGISLFEEAEVFEHKGDIEKAQELFLRAGAVFRIARFPIIRRESRSSVQAWEFGKTAFLRGARCFASPVQEVRIIFSRRDLKAEDSDGDIQTYLRVHAGQKKPTNDWPVIVYICGLDTHRTNSTVAIDEHLAQGFAVICLEIPGTGDCPANPRDPTSWDRLFDSVLAWIGSTGQTTFSLDASTIFARGLSTGSYSAIRAAHLHAEKLTGTTKWERATKQRSKVEGATYTSYTTSKLLFPSVPAPGRHHR
jgi:hypothetical protein